MIDALLERERLVLQVRHEFAVVVVLVGELPAPVRRGEVGGGAVEIAAEVARVVEAVRADLLDRLQEGALQEVLCSVGVDAPLLEHLQQRAPEF